MKIVSGAAHAVTNTAYAPTAAAGLVEWPVLVTVGDTALVLRQLRPRPSKMTGTEVTVRPKVVPAPVESSSAGTTVESTEAAAAKPLGTTRSRRGSST